MKQMLILGGGTGGTIMANKFAKTLDRREWEITVIDRDRNHYYQPGFLFIPFGIYGKDDVVKPKARFFTPEVNLLFEEVEKIKPEENHIILKNGKSVAYDILIIATGSKIQPEEIPGLKDKLWNKDIFNFYTYEGALKLAEKFRRWEGGRLVLNVADMPIKCPVAPLEFVFLADWYFDEVRHMRNKVEITYVTPLAGAFTKPKATKMLSGLLEKKNINVIPDFYLERVDNDHKKLISFDEKEVEFDLLVSIPTNKGDDVIERSGMGDEDELNFIPTDKHTLQSPEYENVFVIGDATNVPASKAGSVVHFMADILYENVLSYLDGRLLEARFDGHANCFIETGYGKAALIDFNYETEPLPGKYPLPGIGPLELLAESKANHYGKLMFRWLYWHMLLKDRPIPIDSHLSLAGKILEDA